MVGLEGFFCQMNGELWLKVKYCIFCIYIYIIFMRMDILYENFVYFTDTDIFFVFVCEEVVDRDLRCYHVFSAMNSQKSREPFRAARPLAKRFRFLV